MNKIVFVILLLFLGLISYGQTVFDEARFVKIKQVEIGYVSLIKGADDAELKEYLVEKYEGYYTEGIALHDKDGEFLWVRVFDDRFVFDVKYENEEIYVLNADWDNSKISSSANLYETILDSNGELLKEVKISYLESDVPNSRIRALYDTKGQIWDWVSWENTESILIDGDKIEGGKADNIRICCHLKDTSYSYLLMSKSLRLLTHDVFENRVGFIIRGNNITTQEENFNLTETVLFEFTTNGEITKTKSIATQGVYVEHLAITENGSFISGTFQGNDSLSFEPSVFLMGNIYTTPNNRYRDETARNGFVLSLNNSYEVNWMRILNSEYHVSIESMSVENDTLVIGVEYKDFINIGSEKILTSKKHSKYEYSNAVLIFFDSKGDIIFYEQAIGNGYESIQAYLLDDKLILYGDFLNRIKLYDIKLKDASVNTCNYLIFRDKTLIETE